MTLVFSSNTPYDNMLDCFKQCMGKKLVIMVAPNLNDIAYILVKFRSICTNVEESANKYTFKVYGVEYRAYASGDGRFLRNITGSAFILVNSHLFKDDAIMVLGRKFATKKQKVTKGGRNRNRRRQNKGRGANGNCTRG